MKGRCVKQETIAVIENNGRYWIGSNWCLKSKDICPRIGLPSGVGYDLCKSECDQWHHAEVSACIKAGSGAKGGTLYLLGHIYCCDSCKKVMDEYGIKEIIIGKLPDAIMRKL